MQHITLSSFEEAILLSGAICGLVPVLLLILVRYVELITKLKMLVIQGIELLTAIRKYTSDMTVQLI